MALKKLVFQHLRYITSKSGSKSLLFTDFIYTSSVPPQLHLSLSPLVPSLFSSTLMAVLNLKPQNDDKENVSPTKVTTISVNPLDSPSSIDKDKTQIRNRRRQPLKDITNLFVSSSPLPSSPTLSFSHKCIQGRSGVGLKAAATSSSTFSCRHFRWFFLFCFGFGIYQYHVIIH